jgi:hypothetical protein
VTRRALGYAALVLVAAAAFWYWPTDRRKIIAAGHELAEAVSIPATEPELARVTRAAILSRLLAPDVRLVGPTGRVGIDGREAALGLATRLRPPRGLTVSIAGLDPSFSDDGSMATSRTTVTLREPGVDGAADQVDTRDVEMTWTRSDVWRLSLVTVLNGDDPE